MRHCLESQRIQTKYHRQPNRYRKIIQRLCTTTVWCIFQHAPYSLKYIGFPIGYMEGRIKPWWDVYICLLPKVYKMSYTNKRHNKCIFFRDYTLNDYSQPRSWPNPSQPWPMRVFYKPWGNVLLANIYQAFMIAGHCQTPTNAVMSILSFKPLNSPLTHTLLSFAIL